MTWNQSITDFKNYLRLERGLSINSITSYALDIKKLINYLEDNSVKISPEKITSAELQQFVYRGGENYECALAKQNYLGA